MNQLTERDRPERASGITIECTPDATAEITWKVLDTERNTQYVVHVDGEQVYLFEDNGHHQTTVPAPPGAWVKAGIFQTDHPYISTETTCPLAEEEPTTTTTTTTTTTVPETVTTTTTAQPAPLTELPHTGAEISPLLPLTMLTVGITLARLGRKKER